MRHLLWTSPLLLLATPALASQVLTGDYVKIAYGSNGSWNYSGTGMQVKYGSTWVDFSYPGTPWQYHAISYKKGGVSSSYYAYYYGASWTVTAESNNSAGDIMESEYDVTAGDLRIVKTETWDKDGTTILVWYTMENAGASTLTDVRVMWAVDPDQDLNTYGTYNTYNDTMDTNGDGHSDYTQSVGVSSGRTIGLGACDETRDSVGHTSSWATSTTATYTDYGGSSGDYTTHWLHTISTLSAGEEVEFGLVITLDDSATDAKNTWTTDGDTLCSSCVDADGDGFSDMSCGGDDCDDTDASNYPGADEVCDGDDNDCDGLIDEDAVDIKTWYPDADDDGYGNDDTSLAIESCEAPEGYAPNFEDCDDADGMVNPGADEICNTIDDDCDGNIDESSAVDAPTWYRDADGDAYGSDEVTRVQCDAPAGYVTSGGDCVDSDILINPGADEYCDGIDNDCDTEIDEGEAIDGSEYFIDGDGDGFGDPLEWTRACDLPEGYSENDDDCDDTSDLVNPDAEEVCNFKDDDCDGDIDEGETLDGAPWWRDLDGDGFGDAGSSIASCEEPSGYVDNDDDCDDRNDRVNPDATEVCNGDDDDCDGSVDEDALDGALWYVDADGDDFGTDAETTSGCDQPSGFVANDEDCDDTSAGINPLEDEIPYDGLDQDCADGDLVDVDDDGFDAAVAGGDDCADNDASIHPGATEDADGVDDDCNGSMDDGTRWGDDDGDGVTDTGGDCDDTDATTFPGAAEVADGIDNDCDGDTDEGTELADDDGDGFSEDDGDCNDGDIGVSPGATEIDDNGIDDDCNGILDDGFIDLDADGYADWGGDCKPDDATVFPGAPELADGQDNDCDGIIDEGTTMGDDDGDGQSERDGDCNDADPTVLVGADEVENGSDDDCDGQIDEGTNAIDDDGDGLSENNGDCDDSNEDVFPGADEIASNGIDDDCDGDLDETSEDVDGDGFTPDDGDCDDATGWASPGLTEMCDGIDNDCDGEVDEDGCDRTSTSEGAGDTGGEKSDPGTCGCSTGSAASMPGLLSGLGLLALLRRRRS